VRGKKGKGRGKRTRVRVGWGGRSGRLTELGGWGKSHWKGKKKGRGKNKTEKCKKRMGFATLGRGPLTERFGETEKKKKSKGRKTKRKNQLDRNRKTNKSR